MEKITKGYSVLLVVLLVLLALAIQAGHPGAVAAKTAQSYNFTVNTQADTHDAHPGDGQCADSKGRCSLRAAIEEADALPKGSSISITVPQGTYRLKLGTLQLTANAITINGASHKTTIINGNQTFGIMNIARYTTVSLSQLTISNGKAKNGGGIYSTGMLTVSYCSISGNSASMNGGGINTTGMLTMSNSIVSNNAATGVYGTGGGIYNAGADSIANVSNSTLSDNSASQHGGGIANGTYDPPAPGGTVRVSNSTLSGNKGDLDSGGIYNKGIMSVNNSTVSRNAANDFGGGDGGGIYNDTKGTMSVSNTTLNGNVARCCNGRGFGGGIFNNGVISVSNSTITGNSAGYEGGGIYSSGSMSVSNSTLSGNSGGANGGANIYNDGGMTLTGTIVANGKDGPNCTGTITEGAGFNLDSGNTCGFSLSNDLNNTDPKLGPLQDNGGPTETMALLQGSKAIDWIPLSTVSSCPATDQRGYPRPDNNEVACDIGAYESAY